MKMKLAARYFALGACLSLAIAFLFIYVVSTDSLETSMRYFEGVDQDYLHHVAKTQNQHDSGKIKHVRKQRKAAGALPLPSNGSKSSISSKMIFVQRGSNWECPSLRRPQHVQETFQFQRVDGKNATFVYSAFLDERDGVVRIIGLKTRTSHISYHCQLWYAVTDVSVPDLFVTGAKVEVIQESHGRRYTAIYIHCPLPNSRCPYAVSVTSYDCHTDVSKPTNVLMVVQPSTTVVHNFTVCIKPVNRRYSRAHELVEFIELNRMFGATKFQLYINSAGTNVQKILDWYQSLGVVEMLDWNIPSALHLEYWPSSPKPPDIHAFGQLASSNDCLNRNRGSSRYLAMVDWDELLVPTTRSNWMDMLHDIVKQHHEASEYQFACLFFRKDFPLSSDDFPGKELALKYRSSTLLVDKREKTPLGFPSRSKYIIDSSGVHIVGIHFVFKHRKGNAAAKIRVPHEFGLNYHYRDWEKPTEYASTKSVKSTDMHRFKNNLLQRLDKVWKHFPKLPMDIPLSAYGSV